MNQNEQTLLTETKIETRQAWEKPEAKVADVASATLAGHTHRNTSDLGTCAS